MSLRPCSSRRDVATQGRDHPRCEGSREARGAPPIIAALFVAPIIAKQISRGRTITD
jgi:hypothetical protein